MNLDDLYNDLISLCEIQGELSPEDNVWVKARIIETRKQIAKLEGKEEGTHKYV